jgi:uncharacterized membrane protein
MGIGLCTVLYLLHTELFAIDAICLWCTGVHLMPLVLFGTTELEALLPTGHPSQTARWAE